MQDAAYHRRMTEPAKPVSIQAATVILAREGPGGVPEYLLVQRGEQLAFAGGALVFPGGRVDTADIHIARNELLAMGFDGLEDLDAAARITCAREALEETGVLLTEGPTLTKRRWPMPAPCSPPGRMKPKPWALPACWAPWVTRWMPPASSPSPAGSRRLLPPLSAGSIHASIWLMPAAPPVR